MSVVRLIPMGVGEAFSARNYTTCLALGCDDRWLLIDCPHPIRKMLREGSLSAGLARPLDIGDFEAVAVTHLHADHASGLEDFAYFTHFGLGQRARILMHPMASDRLWNGMLAAGMERVQFDPDQPPIQKSLADYFDLIDLDATRPVECGPFAIECRRTIHPVPCYALRIRTGGRIFGFSADSAHDPSLIDWLSPADLIVHEATDLAHSRVHTPCSKLQALPETLRSKIRLTHLPDDFDASTCGIEPLREGRVYFV